MFMLPSPSVSSSFNLSNLQKCKLLKFFLHQNFLAHGTENCSEVKGFMVFSKLIGNHVKLFQQNNAASNNKIGYGHHVANRECFSANYS